MKKKKLKKYVIRRIIIIVIIMALIFFIRNITYNISMTNKQKDMRLLLNNEFVELSNEIYVEDDAIYIAEEDVQNIFDETIYYNVGDKELITTYNMHVAVMHLNEEQLRINDVVIPIEDTLKEINSKIYLPINELGNVYDIETEYIESTNMVIMDSTTKSKKQVMVLKQAKIKSSRNPFALTIEEVNKGDYLYVIETSGRYIKVRTASGNIGYIKNKKVSEEEVLREDLQESKLNINVLNENLEVDLEKAEEALDENKDNIIIIDGFSLTKDGQINSSNDTQSEEYYDWTSQNNVGIIAKLKNNSNISSTLETFEQRNVVINALYNQVMQNQYNGVYIDFKEIDDVNSFYRFLIELTPKFKESGLKVIVKLNNQINEEKIKNIVDYII